jgi:methylmalonyl-CoA/ethylmalonyl-CoA epimerase
MNTAPVADLTFDHVGIVVGDLEAGCAHLRGLLGPLAWTARFDDSGLGVAVRFARDGAGMVYELIAPLGQDSPVRRTVQSRRNMINQLAYRTKSLDSAVAHLRTELAVPVGAAKPAVAFGGARVQFLMTPLDFLIELIEIDRIVHQFRSA